MATLRKYLVVIFSSAAFMGVACGLYFAVHSPLFLVQVVEVVDQPENAPVDAQKIVELAAVPVGRVNLFALDLTSIEKRILAQPWVREVQLQKRFPQTLSIVVIYRKPVALMQVAGGNLSYVDENGMVFGHVSLTQQPDLPLLSGFARSGDDKRVSGALELLKTWESAGMGRKMPVSSVNWDHERGYRVLVAYPLGGKQTGEKARAMVDFGQEIDGGLTSQLERLGTVFRYLEDKSIRANQIWADSGKKIVVRTARGS